MCGRFMLLDEPENQEIRKIIDMINERYNHEETPKLKTGDIFPSDYAPVILNNPADKKVLALLKWGFPNPKGKSIIINARQETLHEKPMFRNLLLHKRCLIPASGFYEWKAIDNHKKDKYLIRTKQSAFYMAGLYNTFTDKQNIPYAAFVIITTSANAEMSTIHSRMPVIFHKDKANQWLNYSINDISQLKNLLVPYPDSLILKKAE